VANVFDEISNHHREWIAKQAMFFVATAPLDPDGLVNVSPKGPIGSLAVLGPLRLAYLDAHGSGTETIAHLRENGRICVMLCAFEGPPRILRFHGRGEAVLNDDPRYGELFASADFADVSIPEARRSIVVVDVERVSDSCGYGVPLMSMEGQREHHALSSAKRVRKLGPDGYEDFQRERGAESLDGLPALPPRRP
jgi:predicted pyridoxine 5'-phosphate oxidase superfamily flavin-nucleotide-binding protein